MEGRGDRVKDDEIYTELIAEAESEGLADSAEVDDFIRSLGIILKGGD